MIDTFARAVALDAARLDTLLDAYTYPDALDEALLAVRAEGYDALPLPGTGATLLRWQILATVARHDLSLAKLYESHTDALAILHELEGGNASDGFWAVWCAEPPTHRVRATPTADGTLLNLQGTKAWCSGARRVSHALVSVWDGEQSRLAAVSMNEPGVRITDQGWHAVGMSATESVDVVFDNVTARAVGEPGAYVDRPGFMHGAAGIAACWYGAAGAIADPVLDAARQRGEDPHALAHLGAIDVALAQGANALRAAAADIDAHPSDSCTRSVRRARLAVEAAVDKVQWHAARALGASPFCKDAAFARRVADLPVFVRQSHAERDLANHAQELLRPAGSSPWQL